MSKKFRVVLVAVAVFSIIILTVPNIVAAPTPNFTFGPPQHYPVGSGAAGIAQGDLNGDGRPDLVTSNNGSGSINVLINNGNGTFAPAVNYAAGANAFDVILADLNGDSRLDAVVANNNLSNISVLLGNGNGTFQNAVAYPTSYDAHSVLAGDFNGDGRLDLAVATEASSSINILLGNGNGTFQAPIVTVVGQNPVRVDKGDFNGDGRLDLAVTFDPGPFNVNSTVLVLLGNGNGTFTTEASYQVGLRPYSVITADVNGDGLLDLVTGNSAKGVGIGDISVLLGNGNGTFQSAVNYPASDSSGQVRAADFNGDGKLDLVTADEDNDRISLLFGNGNGSFQAPINYAAGDFSEFMAIADFNGDGKLDLAASDGIGNSATVLLGYIPIPPTITKAFGAASIPYNGTTSLSFTITNPNPNNILSGVAFTDNLPAGLVVASLPNVASTCGGTVTAAAGSGTVSLVGGALAANGNCTINLDVTGITPGVKNNTTLPISASETGAGIASNTATLTVSPAADLGLQKSVNNSTPGIGSNVTFTLTVINNGPSDATNVVVNDPLPTGLNYVSNGVPSQGNVIVNGNAVTWSVGTLTNGTSATLQIIAQVTQSGAILNTITKTQTEPDPNNLNDQASAGLNAPVPPTISKAFGATSIALNGTTTLSFTITNPNTLNTLSGVAFTDNLPAGLVVAATPNVTNPCGGTITATAGSGVVSLAGGNLVASSNCTVSLNVTGLTPGVKNNTTLPISATESGAGKASNTATISVDPGVDVGLQKTVDNRTPNVNDNVTFTLTATNSGPVTATNVVVIDALPAGLSYVSNGVPTQGSVGVAGNTVTWTVGILGNGSTATLQIVAQVTQSGTIVNTITKTQSETDTNSLNDQASVGLNAPTADLGIKKSVDISEPKVGDSVTFNITLTNNGPDPATGAVARDLLPAGLDYVSSVAPAATSYNPATGDWTVGSLTSGQSIVLQIVAKTTQEGDFTNTATKVRQDQYDFNLTNDAASASVTVGPIGKGGKSKPKVYPADFIVQLRVSPDRLASTDSANLISYTVYIKNIGQGKADHVSIPFPIDPNLEIGYTTFSDYRMWVSEIVTGSTEPHVQINLPPLEPKQWLSATLVFRPKAEATPGAVLFTRYYVHWDDEEKAGKKAGSNAVRFSLSEDGTNRDDTGGAVQLSTPSNTSVEPDGTLTISSDFYAPYELVNLWYTDKAGVSVSLGALNASPEGKLSFQFDAKGLGLTPGETYVVAGQGVRSEVRGSSVISVSP